jgi:hypothetical protein
MQESMKSAEVFLLDMELRGWSSFAQAIPSELVHRMNSDCLLWIE